MKRFRLLFSCHDLILLTRLQQMVLVPDDVLLLIGDCIKDTYGNSADKLAVGRALALTHSSFLSIGRALLYSRIETQSLQWDNSIVGLLPSPVIATLGANTHLGHLVKEWAFEAQEARDDIDEDFDLMALSMYVDSRVRPAASLTFNTRQRLPEPLLARP